MSTVALQRCYLNLNLEPETTIRQTFFLVCCFYSERRVLNERFHFKDSKFSFVHSIACIYTCMMLVSFSVWRCTCRRVVSLVDRRCSMFKLQSLLWRTEQNSAEQSPVLRSSNMRSSSLQSTRGVRCLRKCLESGAPRPACGTLLLSLCTEDGVLEVVVEVLGRWAGGRA